MAVALNKDLELDSYAYELPEELIAQSPTPARDQSRLLYVPRRSGRFQTRVFREIIDLLPENALLVGNDSRVVPARVPSRRAGGGKLEFLLLTPTPLISQGGEIECLLKPSSKVKIGETISLFPGAEIEIIAREDFGVCKARIAWDGDLEELFFKYGSTPLPPYIKRAPEKADLSRYQTIWAAKSGSVAAPTAGFHFTPAILDALAEKGVEKVDVTLHVGYGTFSPTRSADVSAHKMHPEYAEISEAAARQVNDAKESGRPIIAVGTTAARTLEGVRERRGKLEEFAGWLNLFIYPGFDFKIIDGLITNFHLPKSTLLMLVAALAGRERILDAYALAKAEKFRFYSYGDAMLVY